MRLAQPPDVACIFNHARFHTPTRTGTPALPLTLKHPRYPTHPLSHAVRAASPNKSRRGQTPRVDGNVAEQRTPHPALSLALTATPAPAPAAALPLDAEEYSKTSGGAHMIS
jgi:hypothetical protein